MNISRNKPSRVDIDVRRVGKELWLTVRGVMTTVACEDTLAVLRAEIALERTHAVALDLRRAVVAINNYDWGRFAKGIVNAPFLQPVCFIVTSAIPVEVRAAYVKVMADLGFERAFFEDQADAAMWVQSKAREFQGPAEIVVQHLSVVSLLAAAAQGRAAS